MRKIFALIAALFAASPAFAGNLCGSGVLCLNQNTEFTHVTAPLAGTTLTIFTCKSVANGCLVPAIFLFGNMAGATDNRVTVAMVTGGVSSILFNVAPEPALGQNIATAVQYPPQPLPNAPVDGNGNPVIFMSPGSSLTLTTSLNIDASGNQSGSLDVVVYAQQF